MAGPLVSDGARLTLADARRSPCLSCSTSPCCTHLPVHSFRMTTLADLDHALYLLNFDAIRLGLAASGEWSVYYARPCRHLDPRDATCTVHGTDRQPNICVTYNPYQCWYRRVFDAPVEDFVWFDRARLERLAAEVTFDDLRTIVEVPSWEQLVAEAAPPPPDPRTAPAPTGVAATAVTTAVPLTLGPTRRRDDPAPAPAAARPDDFRTFDALRTPCEGCAAYCCTTLVFPKPVPTTNVHLDHWRFTLGFPGVQVGIGDDGWSLVLETTCRHLGADHRCGVFGLPERPLRCSYYDAWTCGYTSRFGPDPRPDFHRLGLAEFDTWLGGVGFDATGTVTSLPPL